MTVRKLQLLAAEDIATHGVVAQISVKLRPIVWAKTSPELRVAWARTAARLDRINRGLAPLDDEIDHTVAAAGQSDHLVWLAEHPFGTAIGSARRATATSVLRKKAADGLIAALQAAAVSHAQRKESRSS